MSYYNSCSPYDTQQRNGQCFDFEKIKKHYDDTPPIRGKRKPENIRPVYQRNRCWERMIKVSDTEYYITYDAWSHRSAHNRAITFSLNDGFEFMTVHTPKAVWNNPDKLYPEMLRSASIFWFYHFNMPNGFGMENYYTSKYVKYNGNYYTIEKGDIIFQRKVGDTEWKPLQVHREFKYALDRKQTKELRKMTAQFLPYYDIMCDIVEPQYIYGNVISEILESENPDDAIALFKPSEDGSVPPQWFKMVEYYKIKIRTYKWDYNNLKHDEIYRRDLLHRKINENLFQLVKPCTIAEVPLGKPSHDRYKRWYR